MAARGRSAGLGFHNSRAVTPALSGFPPLPRRGRVTDRAAVPPALPRHAWLATRASRGEESGRLESDKPDSGQLFHKPSDLVRHRVRRIPELFPDLRYYAFESACTVHSLPNGDADWVGAYRRGVVGVEQNGPIVEFLAQYNDWIGDRPVRDVH